jgi:polyhydroxyalkanoate synthase
MTTNDFKDAAATQGNAGKLQENLARIEELSQRLVAAMSHHKPVPAPLQGPNQELYAHAASALMAEMVTNPAKVWEEQAVYWGKSLQNFIEAQKLLVPDPEAPPPAPAPEPRDKRFSNPMWDSNPYFKFVRDQYLLNAEAVQKAVAEIDHLDPREKKRLEYFSTQIVNMFSPTNFFGTNPDALTKAMESDGQSVVDGLENLVSDLEANNGELVVTLADRKAFKVGENLATSPGNVVFRNRLFELIQYAPTTKDVHKTPLIIFPPWINKFYILDLKPQNSLIKWIVDQGYTLFVVSWVNPDATYRDTAMADYIEQGYLTAFDQVKAICDVDKINAVGYCIAGTTLSLTLALMKKRGDTSVKSATFFTTLTDFSDPGEVGVFLDDDFVDGIEAEANKAGILRSFYMARTFSYLRSNDLIYAPAIRSYMMGEAPPAFDLLYWNGDGTNLPAKMAVEYLRGLCQGNLFATKGMSLAGETLRLRDVTIPVCAIACETDHIAPWKSSFRGIKGMGSKDKTFILSESGHIAGIVNPPSKNKYGHYTNPDWDPTPEEWLAAADKHAGSWWPKWEAWLARQSGKMVPARAAGDSDHPALAAAPGSYVSAIPAEPAP